MSHTELRLQGRTALVTAAAQGIGRFSAQALAAAGARVVATDVDETNLATLREEGVETCRMDVRDSASVLATVARTGAVNILFNCAGFVHPERFSIARTRSWTSHMI